jgi:hypothetical protein
MLFITPYGKVVDGHTINRVFYKVCKLQGIPYYTTGNLRKTYMTNVARHARKNGRSLSGLEQLFDHKSTTFNIAGHKVTRITLRPTAPSVVNYFVLQATYTTNWGTETVLIEGYGGYEAQQWRSLHIQTFDCNSSYTIINVDVSRYDYVRLTFT